ncbi:hypothetical protein B0T16DRAFT_420001 [Cercophora newfieldiana]|uniref:Uncharacterized protein n=1 Tax=Cercophora newfieldiana TaxID=92897 RepID=A0AA39XXD0_9PEZI|nr:hypothetical protein B0T16DRAFT_420001 [Cercophora newfieldiana]
MLERTAASIETCSLQKVLPATRPPFTTRRHLHTNFWSHGASGVELLDACRALMSLPSADREAPPAQQPTPTPTSRRSDPMTASAFLLDFLYPGGAAALLQRLRPNFPQRSEPSHMVSGRISARAFTSSASDSSRTSSPPVKGPNNTDAPEEVIQGENLPLHHDGSQAQNEGSAFDGLPTSGPIDSGVPRGRSDPQILRDLMSSHGQSYDMVWEEYLSLRPSDRLKLRIPVAVHLANSNRRKDAERVSGLFSQLTPEDWTPEVVDAAVRTKLAMHDTSSALDIYEAALSQRSIGLGIDALISYGLRTKSWQFLTRLLPIHSTTISMCGAFEYKWVSSLDELSRRISRFHRWIMKQKPDAAAELEGQLNGFLGCVARTSITSLQPEDAKFVLLHSKDPASYHSYIAFCIREQKFDQAGKLYRKYRKLSDVHIPLDILRPMLDVYKDNLPEIERVMEDYVRFHHGLDLKAIKKIIPMYARRGDVESVAYLARQWAEISPQSLETDPVPCIASQMHAHAMRAEPDAARHLLVEATRKTGKPTSPILWNILLNAYTKNNDYEGALRTLFELCDVGTPDHISFGTVMNFAAFRGDLDSTIDLFTLATEKGVNPDISMVDAVMEAYCQNDRFPEAEAFCHKMTRTRPVPGDYVILWNTLLRHLAIRRDLNGVNRALEKMKAFDVRYDNDTYSHLLTGLVNCRQAHHALQFLRTSVENRIFRPTYDHYMLLMAAFVQSREPHIVKAIDNKLKHLRVPGSPQQVTTMIKAFETWSKMPEARKKGKAGRDYIASALHEFYKFVETANPTTTKDVASTTGMYSRMMFILTQLRDFASVQELLELYQRQFPESSSPETTPVLLLHNVMLSDFYEKNYASVKSTWEIVLERTIREGQPPALDPTAGFGSGGADAMVQGVLPAYRFWLSKPLQTMQRLYLAESNADGLLALVTRVQEAGFELDRSNWNYHIQALAALQRWREAFLAFEEHLMPYWTGWATARHEDPGSKNLLPLETRRLGSYPRKLRPLSETLFLLAREYKQMARDALWSKDASRALNTIGRDCPKVVQAISTLMRTDSELENMIFEGPLVDLGNGKTRKTVPDDYFDKVLFKRLGITKAEGTDESALGDTPAEGGHSEFDLLEKALEEMRHEGKVPQAEDDSLAEEANVSDGEEWEDVDGLDHTPRKGLFWMMKRG